MKNSFHEWLRSFNWAHSDCSLQLNCGDDEKIQIWPCKPSKRNVIIIWILTLVTAGLLRLIFYWRPLLYALFTCDLCESGAAKQILVKSEGEYHLRTLKMHNKFNGLSLFCPGGSTINVTTCRYFTFKKMIFVWHPTLRMFHKVFALDTDVPLTTLASQKGLTSAEASKRFAVLGANETAIELKPIFVLLFNEVFSPFYFFQVFSVAVWYSEGYKYYATIIIVLSTISVTVNVWQTRRNQRNLRDMMYSVGTVTVWRDKKWQKHSTTALVPGDIIFIPDTGEIHCDAVLLRGSVIVNEAMLTGESVPTAKAPLCAETAQPGERYNSKEHAKQTLFCGTKILQTKHARGESVVAVVIRTGFATTKGRLVRTIMYPKSAEFGLMGDLFRFIGIFFIIAVIGFVYTIILMVRRGNGVDRIALRSLDIITIVIPPALPAAITIGIIATQRRLKKARIFCTSPESINIAGAINVACFDKTGTLTEDGLDLYGVIPNDGMQAKQSAISISQLPPDCDMTRVMASCHSLTQLGNELAGDPMDVILFSETKWTVEGMENRKASLEPTPTDELFSPTPLELVGEVHVILVQDEKHKSNGDNAGTMVVKSPSGETRVKLLHEYAFSSALRRMSVLVNVTCEKAPQESGLYLFCKGAPETVITLCLPRTVSPHFSEVLQSHAKSGFRIIALSCKRIYKEVDQVLKMTRLDVETDMTFLGFVIFENRLKEQTIPNIRMLKDAHLRTVMVTGDNMLTAVSVAKECGLLDDRRPIYTIEAEIVGGVPEVRLSGEDEKIDQHFGSNSTIRVADMVDNAKRRRKNLGLQDLEASYQLAISGSSFAVIKSKLPHLIPYLTATCDVYARMAPDQKIQLVTNLQELGYIASMCGDGANDCGALKAAHVGCSLSQAEASIASPFTSSVPDISCIPTLIREGRSCLVTTFCIVQYMCIYSLIQFLAVVLLYWIGSILSDFQFLYSDLALTTSFAVFFGYTASSPTLSKKPPETRIMSLSSLLSIFIQMILILAFQIFMFRFVQIQPWFFPFVFPGDDNVFDAYETTCVFFIAAFQQIVLCIVYSKSRPYRRSILSNYGLAGTLFSSTLNTVILLIAPAKFLIEFFEFKLPPIMKFRIFILLIAAFHFFLALAADELTDYLVPLIRRLSPFEKKQPKYADILLSPAADSPSWLFEKTAISITARSRHSNMAYQNPAYYGCDDF